MLAALFFLKLDLKAKPLPESVRVGTRPAPTVSTVVVTSSARGSNLFRAKDNLWSDNDRHSDINIKVMLRPSA